MHRFTTFMILLTRRSRRSWNKRRNSGAVVKADTIEALAEGMKVDAATLKATYDRATRNRLLRGKTNFGKAAENLTSLETAPYYAVVFYPTTFGSRAAF